MRTDKPLKQKKQKPIKKVSDKRKKELQDYSDLKKVIIEESKKNKSYRCFFCDKPFNNIIPDIHHLDGREESLLLKKDNLVLVHRICHSKLHDSTFENLEKHECFNDFIERLKIYPEIYERFKQKKTKCFIGESYFGNAGEDTTIK